MSTTAQIRLPSTVNEARRLRKIVGDLEGKFREQRQLLSRQGMSLPPGTLTALQTVRDGLDELTVLLENRYTDLLQLRELARTTEVINSTLALDAVLNEVMDTVISLTKAERGYLMLKNPSTGQLEFNIARNIDQRNLNEDEFQVSRTVVTEVASTGLPVVTVNAGADPRFNMQQSIIGFALRSILCVPLVLKGQVTGVVYTDNRVKQGLFTERESQLLQVFANQAATAIENARLFESRRGTLDQITSMKNLMDYIFASIASGVITLDLADRITELNEAACQILTMEKRLGANAWEVLPQLQTVLAPNLAAVREQKIVVAQEITHLRNGSPTNLSLKLSPLRSTTDGAISDTASIGVAIVVDDQTDLKQREAQLNVVRRYLTPAMVDNIQSIDSLGLGGERRFVSVFFLDVRSFSTFPRGLSPQQQLALLNHYLTMAADSIQQQNGIIDKYISSEVMALFNTQLNRDDDHPWHAVQAALDATDAFREAYQRNGEPDGVAYFRIGINTGDATLGNVGSENRKEFTAIGDTINVGHRLLENANLGEIVIAAETARLCWDQLTDPANRVVILGHEALSVKGRTNAVMAYRIKRA